jgi:glucuronate isomerase
MTISLNSFSAGLGFKPRFIHPISRASGFPAPHRAVFKTGDRQIGWFVGIFGGQFLVDIDAMAGCVADEQFAFFKMLVMREDFIVFTLGEISYARELAPLAGHYPTMKLGPAWWFNDSPESMRRFREMTTETAGFYSTVGFNDDTSAFLPIPARLDVARRMDCGWLAQLVVEHRMEEWEAAELVVDLAYNLAKAAYKL